VTPEARSAAATLSQAPRPLVAAVVEGLIAHPEVVREKSELLGVQGVGDDGLDRLIGDLIPLIEDLGDAAESLVRARLASMGHEETLRRIERTAPLAHAAFLDRTLPEREAGRDLIRALELVQQSVSLSRALEELKGDLSGGAALDSQAFSRLKAERDAAARALIAGQLWPEATVH
jgi:DNA primase